MMAGIGMDWLIQIKEPAKWWQTADGKITKKIGKKYLGPAPTIVRKQRKRERV
jgi:hypothetical protein